MSAVNQQEQKARISPEYEDMRAYREKLRAYSTEELEDIYFHINILRHPLRYRLIKMELEERKLHLYQPPPAVPWFNLRTWMESYPFFARHRLLKASLLSLSLLLITCGITFLLLLPIWICAVPLKFLGAETAIVYFACAPVPPMMAASVGFRIGGRGVYSIWVLLGAAAGIWLFHLTGTPDLLLKALVEPRGSGGFSFGGF
jgi:hypothetical protein